MRHRTPAALLRATKSRPARGMLCLPHLLTSTARGCPGLRSRMQYGVYLFFAGCVIVMTLWVAVWLPETRGVPVEHVMAAWATCAPPRLPLPPVGSPWSKCMLRRIRRLSWVRRDAERAGNAAPQGACLALEAEGLGLQRCCAAARRAWRPQGRRRRLGELASGARCPPCHAAAGVRRRALHIQDCPGLLGTSPDQRCGGPVKLVIIRSVLWRACSTAVQFSGGCGT